MGWQDIYKKKMQESGLAAGDINFVDVDTFHKREKERWASEVATGSVQTVTAPAKQEKEKYVASPYGTFLGGFSYKGNTRRQKTEQELADEAAQQAAYIKEYQRLAGLDLDRYGKQVESAKKAAQDNRTMYNVRAFGGYDASRKTDEERTYAAMQADYNKAKDIQYDIKGQAALENLTAEQSKAVETLATERSDTAKRQTAWTALQKTGLSDDDIAQLVNYQRNIPKRQKNAERYAEMQDAAEAYAETNPSLATVASVPANLLSGIGTFDAAMRKLSDPDSPVDYKSGAFLPYAYSRGVRDTVTKNLESDYGKAASFAYGVGTSILDSAATVGLAALGIPAGVASATLGGAAATSAMTEAKARGLSDEKAILTGVLSGVAETAFEKFSLESLISMKLPTGTAKQRVVGALKNAAVQAGIEGSEEMFTDFANLIFDSAVNGSMSDVQQRIAVYMAGGMDYDEARKKVLGETVKDVALDFVAGGLAGGLMGGGSMALQTAAQGAYDARVNDARTVVRQRAGVTGSYQAAEDGKTSYNGQETSVRSVVKDGKVELTTGETVDPKDVQFSDRNTADLYEGAIRTAENAGAAQVFVDSYTGGDVSTYILGMQEAYHNGKEGVPLEDAGGFAADLSDAQRRAAWEQGRAAASVPDLKDYGFGEKGTQAWNKVQENEAVRNNRRLRAGFTAMYQAGMRGESASAVKSDAAKYIPPSVQTAAYQAGLADAAESLARETDAVQFVSSAGSESGLVDNEYSRKLAEEKSGTAALLSMLGKDLGVRVEIVPKVLGGNANGQYVAGRNLIQIAADADNAFAFVAAHEVTHRMQSLAPEEYRSYRDYAMRFRAQELGEEGTVALVERYRSMSEEAGVTLTQEEAMDEIAANFTMQMIEDGGLFEDFARENRSEAGKLLDALKAFIAKVKALFRSKEARDKAAREAYGTDVATLEECVARWQKAYTAAGKQAQRVRVSDAVQQGDTLQYDDAVYSLRVTDKDTLDFLNGQKTIKTYKTMQIVDGKLYPPMAARVDGKYEDASELGKWEMAVERPDLVKDGKFKLDKGKGQGSLTAAYNPYMHSSNLVINDQFSGAYTRNNLVTVECEVPVSEMTSGYHAEGAKDGVGWHSWHTGTVAGQIRRASGTERKVFLSRWIKPVRILPDAEVAGMYKDLLGDTGIAVPDNVVTPSLLKELRKVGVAISESGRVNAKTAAGEGSGEGRYQIKNIDNQTPTSDPDIRFSLKGMDSAGRQLSEQQQEYFKDSKVRDAEGRLKVMYRGGDETFTVFDRKKSKYSNLYGRGFYFTDSESHAKQYGNAKSFYLNITRPVSTTETTITQPQLKKFLEAVATNEDDFSFENYGYGATVDGVLESVYGKSDFAMLYDINQTAIGDMVAAVELFNEVNGTDYDGLILDTETVAFRSAQIKNIDNQTPTSDPDIRFSLKKPVEETKNLLALHNLTEKNLLDAVRLGGLPMPSIAVVKGDAGHSEYGPISFVFSKDTIDPKLFRSNKVYGYDAWTPTAPQIEYEVNEKAAGRIHDLFYRMQREKGRDFADPLYSVANTLEDELNRKGGLDKVVEPMRDDPRVMNIYLEDTGRGAVEKVMRQNVSRMDENQQEMSEFLIRELGADAVDGFRPTGNEAPIAARRRWFAEHGEALNEALRKYYEKLGLPAKDAADVVNAETNAAKTKYLLNTRKYLSGNTETVTEEVDLDATNNAIRKKVDKADYDRWLDELFKGVVKNEGIYNGKDYYTSSGNRRSFSATHYEITLENIVKAMKRGDQKGTNTFFGGQAIWGVASKDYNSIDEIKADSGRLVKMTEEEYSAIRQEYSARLAELANEIKDPSAQNDFIASDDAATAIVETLRTKRTAAAIDKELRTYPTLRIRPDTAGKVLQLFEDISNMPTGYFEAKPQRAVGFDEVLAAVIPDDTSANARAALAQAGVKTIEYKSGDEQSRKDAVNSVEGARFQLKSARELEQEVKELKKERTALLSRNKTLEARVEKWRKETRRSSPTVRADDVKKLAGNVIREYGSSVDYQDIEADMTALGEALMADDVSMDTLRPHARAAAEKIIDGVLVQSESGAELLEIRDHLKGTTLKYTDDGTIPDFSQWRKSQKGKLRISKDSGVDVDVAYAELTEMFGEGYFPSSIIHTGDQLVRMSEVLENVGRIYENPFDGYRDAAVTELSNLLIDGMIGEDVRQSDPTFADRKALELQETKARMMQMLIRTREGRDRQVERMRRHYAEQTKAGRERRNATALRAKIARHTADLSRKLLTPTDKQHVPEKLRTSVAALLASINQESSYSYDADGRLVHNTEGDPTKRTQAAIALKSAYDEILRSGEALVIDPDLLGSEGAGLLDQVMAFGNKRMADMNSEELTTVWQAVRAIEQSVSTFNKSLASQRYETVSAWAESLKQDSATRKRKNRKLSLDLADPYTFFSAYGESGRQIFRTLRNAQDRQNTMLKTIQAAAERFADKTVFKNRNDRHTFTTEAGQTLTLTTGQVMNLYNLVGRGEQAVHHLMVGGVVQPEILRNGKNPAIPRGTENIRLTENDLKAITGTLTEVQKSVAEGLQKIASGHLAAWGNEASMQVYGYRKFTEKNYWPIKAAQEGTTQNSEKGADMAREIKNMGSAKALVPNASNALDIGDVYDVFSQNASDMIQYATLLAPMEDINRLYNYRFRDAEGNLTGKVVKHVLTDVYGEAAQKYWRNLMRDVQNGMEKSGTSAITKAVEKVVGGMKAGSVGFNLRVVAQQPTAYFRAAAVIDPAHMAKGLVKGATGGNGWEKAKKYAPIAAIKDTSGFDQGGRYTIAQNVFGQDGNALMNWLSEASGWAAGKADAATWEKIWNACEWAVVSENSYEKGSDGFYQRTAQLFTEVIDQSQVVDGILQRAQIMRDSNGLTKQATAFMGEPLKSLNMLMRSYDAWRYETDTPKKSKALKRFARTVSALLVTDVVNSLVQSVIDGLRDDDKDKAYGERIMAAWLGDKDDQTAMQRLLGGNLWENLNPVGRIPYAKDVLSMLQGFTVSRMDADAVGDLIDAAELFAKSAQDEGSKTTAYAAKKLLTAGSKIFGISIANVGRDAWAIARSIAQGTGNVRAMYEMERAIYRLAPDSGNNKRYYKLLYMAMGKDEETYRYIYDDMKKRGYTDSQLQTGIKNIIKDSGADEGDMRKQLEEIGYSGDEAQEVMDKWAFKEKYGYDYSDKREAFAEGTITRQQLIDEIVKIGGNTREEAESAVTVYEWQNAGVDIETNQTYIVNAYEEYGKPNGIDRNDFVSFCQQASRISGEDLDGDGKTDIGSKKKNVLRLIDSMPLSASQKDALYYQQGYAESTIGDAPWH